ncbi:MAG: tetratricopeptide repeat protein [Planctomycetaceae bacterium]
MIEYAPDPPEFDWWNVHEQHEYWRVGRKITVARPGWRLRWKVAVFLFAVGVLAWSSIDMILHFSERQPERRDLILAIVWLMAVALAVLAAITWTIGSRRITIDWDRKHIHSKRGIVARRYPFSDLERLELRAGPSRLADTAELVLVLKRTQLQLLETYYEENKNRRFRTLATVAQRLSDSLHVPLRRPSANDLPESSAMTNLELGEKYVTEGGKMEMHARIAELDGTPAVVEQYRAEAVFLYRTAHDLNPGHREPLLALGRISDDDALHRRAVEIAMDEGVDDVSTLLARAHLHHQDGNYELCLEDLDRAVELEPSVRTLNDRGVVLYFQGRSEDALSDFDQAVRLEPGNARMHQWRSDCWRRIFNRSNVQQHRDHAIDAIDRALELDPKNTQYRQDRSRLLADEPRTYEQAVADLNQLCADNPRDFTLYRSRGELHLEHRDGIPSAIGDFSRMIEILDKQSAPAGDSDAAHMNAISMAYRLRSEAYRMYGDFAAADSDLARAEELDRKMPRQ